eukprot:3067657-Rhodomonas_salina.1
MRQPESEKAGGGGGVSVCVDVGVSPGSCCPVQAREEANKATLALSVPTMRGADRDRRLTSGPPSFLARSLKLPPSLPLSPSFLNDNDVYGSAQVRPGQVIQVTWELRGLMLRQGGEGPGRDTRVPSPSLRVDRR